MTTRRWGLVLLLAGALLLLAALAVPARTQAAAPAAATPTVDRLAAPPTVENPSQADVGAQVFWLNCQPCHGDQGQGLTQDWINQYPPEDRNCWNSNCHGKVPYEGGFSLPKTVPAVIGPDTLTRFNSAADLHGFISQAMPFNKPASLSADDYWALTAFLLRAHAAGSLPPLDSDAQAALIGVHGTVTPPTPTVPALLTATPTPAPFLSGPGGQWLGLVGVAALVALAAGLLARAAARAGPDRCEPNRCATIK